FVAHEGTPLKHNDKSDGVPEAQQIFKHTAVARETDRSPNLCGFVIHTVILCGWQREDKPASGRPGRVKPAPTGALRQVLPLQPLASAPSAIRLAGMRAMRNKPALEFQRTKDQVGAH
ncbi:MAG: hypothetical protein ACT6Q9_11860, partial [Polaromonas sp.]|uniref:hypothetical protein n=1 Tax=Polaromonas sp. TaxID=1869339 RepID=UPI00403686E6